MYNALIVTLQVQNISLNSGCTITINTTFGVCRDNVTDLLPYSDYVVTFYSVTITHDGTPDKGISNTTDISTKRTGEQYKHIFCYFKALYFIFAAKNKNKMLQNKQQNKLGVNFVPVYELEHKQKLVVFYGFAINTT